MKPKAKAPVPELTPQEKEYLALLVRDGTPETVAMKEILEVRRAKAALDAGDCPGCGIALYRRVDPRQIGPQEMQGGTWVNYFCLACKFRCDRYEKPVTAESPKDPGPVYAPVYAPVNIPLGKAPRGGSGGTTGAAKGKVRRP